MIRPTTPADTEAIVALTAATTVFKTHEIEALREVLADYHSVNHTLGHICVTDERDGRVMGYAYYAPAAMTDRSWHLYWIAVDRTTQARGIGGELLRHVETDTKKHGGRVLFIETSSLPHYALTRKFYEKHKYDVTGVLKDYYADGDDM